MLKILQKIIATKTVTEKYTAAPVAERSRGEVAVDGGCIGCGACVAACPTGAISVVRDEVSIDQRACVFCGRCVELCEQKLLRQTGNYRLAELAGQLQPGTELREKIIRVLGRSLQIRHLDAGSCNACDWELAALNNPIYDLQQYGIDFVASPRHADMLMVTGVVTRNLTQAVQMTYEATPAPRLVMAVGACACSGRTFGRTYAVRGAADSIIPVDIYVPGCPPKPQALIYALLLALDRLK